MPEGSASIRRRLFDEEVREIIDNCYAEAKRIIGEHIDVLHSCSRLLLEKEKSAEKNLKHFLRRAKRFFPRHKKGENKSNCEK